VGKELAGLVVLVCLFVSFLFRRALHMFVSAFVPIIDVTPIE